MADLGPAPVVMFPNVLAFPQARVAHPAVIIVGTHCDLLSSREDKDFLDMQLTELANKYHIPSYQPGVLQSWKEPPADGVWVYVWCDGV